MARSVWSPATIPVALAVLVCMKGYCDILDAFLTAVSGMQDILKMAKPLWSLAAISAAFAVFVYKNLGVAFGKHGRYIPACFTELESKWRDFDVSSDGFTGMQEKLWMAKHLWSLAAIPLAFAVFVYKNGGVAVGDKEHHVPVQHYMQIPYLLLFTAGCLTAVHFIPSRYSQALTSNTGKP